MHLKTNKEPNAEIPKNLLLLWMAPGQNSVGTDACPRQMTSSGSRDTGISVTQGRVAVKKLRAMESFLLLFNNNFDLKNTKRSYPTV